MIGRIKIKGKGSLAEGIVCVEVLVFFLGEVSGVGSGLEKRGER